MSGDSAQKHSFKPSDRAPTPQEMIARYGRDMFNDFDLDDPGFNEHYFEVFDQMVQHCPIVRANVGKGYWMVTRNADIRRVAQDWRTFSNAEGFQPNRPEGNPILMPEESDPPKHTAWRDALNPFMSPNAVAKYEAPIRKDVDTLIDAFIDRGECDFVYEFGSKLPGWAFFKNILGVPVDDLAKLIHHFEEATFAPSEQRPAHYAALFDYLGAYLQQRAKEPPKGDMIDTIIKGVDYGDGVISPWEDRLSTLVDVAFGGVATTTYVMACAMDYLATNPDARQQLLDNRNLIPMAVEEFARMFSPVVALGRTCTRDVELAGQPLKKGEFVMVAYAAANRDPRVVEDPHRIDFTRESLVHTAFGVGPHRCLGSNLARMELRTFLEQWLERIPHFSIKPGTAPVYQTGTQRAMSSLYLVF